MTKVSVIVPIYNVEDYLERNLTSLLNQSYSDFEVLMINDGSLDDSQKIIDAFQQKDARFKGYLKENGGLSSARNYGLERIDSEYVMLIDSDDFCEENMIETCVSHMEQDDLDMFVFGYNQYYVETNTKEKIELGIQDGVYTLSENPSILAYTPNAAWNKMYRTSLFRNNDIIYPHGYRHQDLGTTGKLLFLAKRVGYTNQALYNYLIDRPNNITSKVDKKAYHIIDMVKEILEYYQAHQVFEIYKDELYYLTMINLTQTLRKLMGNQDQNFVLTFIKDAFDFKKQYFKSSACKYPVASGKGDWIYQHKYLCQLYYKFKQR